jgi:hypothetical protein
MNNYNLNFKINDEILLILNNISSILTSNLSIKVFSTKEKVLSVRCVLVDINLYCCTVGVWLAGCDIAEFSKTSAMPTSCLLRALIQCSYIEGYNAVALSLYNCTLNKTYSYILRNDAHHLSNSIKTIPYYIKFIDAYQTMRS